MARELPDWSLPEADLLGLIQSLQEKKLWADSISPMVEYLARYSTKATPVRLKLCRFLFCRSIIPLRH